MKLPVYGYLLQELRRYSARVDPITGRRMSIVNPAGINREVFQVIFAYNLLKTLRHLLLMGKYKWSQFQNVFYQGYQFRKLHDIGNKKEIEDLLLNGAPFNHPKKMV